MINNENNDNKVIPEGDKNEKDVNTGIMDVAHMTVQCHILIKDVDTGQILLNKRG